MTLQYTLIRLLSPYRRPAKRAVSELITAVNKWYLHVHNTKLCQQALSNDDLQLSYRTDLTESCEEMTDVRYEWHVFRHHNSWNLNLYVSKFTMKFRSLVWHRISKTRISEFVSQFSSFSVKEWVLFRANMFHLRVWCLAWLASELKDLKLVLCNIQEKGR